MYGECKSHLPLCVEDKQVEVYKIDTGPEMPEVSFLVLSEHQEVDNKLYFEFYIRFGCRVLASKLFQPSSYSFFGRTLLCETNKTKSNCK